MGIFADAERCGTRGLADGEAGWEEKGGEGKREVFGGGGLGLLGTRPRCATGNCGPLRYGQRPTVTSAGRNGPDAAKVQQCAQGGRFWCAFLATLARHWYTGVCISDEMRNDLEHALRRRKSDVPVWLCEIWSIRGSARCAFWATFGPRFRPRDEARAGVAMRNYASRRFVATSFLRRPKSDVTVLLCEICHTRGWGSKTRAAVALVEPCEITKNRNYD